MSRVFATAPLRWWEYLTTGSTAQLLRGDKRVPNGKGKTICIADRDRADADRFLEWVGCGRPVAVQRVRLQRDTFVYSGDVVSGVDAVSFSGAMPALRHKGGVGRYEFTRKDKGPKAYKPAYYDFRHAGVSKGDS